jgi:hypothetical protein
MFATKTSGLYYKHVTIVNYNSSVVNKLGASLSNDARVIIYDHYVYSTGRRAYLSEVSFSCSTLGPTHKH